MRQGRGRRVRTITITPGGGSDDFDFFCLGFGDEDGGFQGFKLFEGVVGLDANVGSEDEEAEAQRGLQIGGVFEGDIEGLVGFDAVAVGDLAGAQLLAGDFERGVAGGADGAVQLVRAGFPVAVERNGDFKFLALSDGQQRPVGGAAHPHPLGVVTAADRLEGPNRQSQSRAQRQRRRSAGAAQTDAWRIGVVQFVPILESR